MYKRSESRDATTLPQAAMASLSIQAKVAAVASAANNIPSLTTYNNSNKINNNNNNCVKNQTNQYTENQKASVENCRPTYGAYICNALPRGPYLQYKFNDQQQSIRHLNEIDNNEQQHEQQEQPRPKHHHNHQLETACKDFRSLQCVSSNPISHNPLSNYHPVHYHHTQHNANTIAPRQYTSSSDTTHQNQFHPHGGNGNSRTNFNLNSMHQNNKTGAPNYATTSTKNWHQIKSSNGICDKILPSKGYQTLPHKLKSGQGGSHGAAVRNFEYDQDIKLSEIHMKSAMLPPQSGNDFLHQIKQKNSNMLARMAAATQVKNVPRAQSQVDTRYQLGPQMKTARPLSEPPTASAYPQNRIPINNSSNHVNCVTLADVIRVKPDGLNEFEGWALLCQSVQALQDLFLADTPSTSRILPLVRSSAIQITSRGRIVFIVTTTVGHLDKFNDASSYYDVTAHLSPEYLNGMGKKIAFAESDIEKMWIYSLGITLRKTIKRGRNNEPASSPVGINPTASRYDDNNKAPINSEQRSVNYPYSSATNNTCRNNGLETTLDQVIGCMCEHNLLHRASLMYLLDVISTFCRNQQQVKPFSHIVMELFAEVTSAHEKEVEEATRNSSQPTMISTDGFRSETDSGRSSAHGEKELATNGPFDYRIPALTTNADYENQNQQNLKVIRNRAMAATDVGYQKFGTIGYAGVKTLLQKKENNKPPPLQIVRRNKEGILKRRNSFRRNTIDINLFDLEKARQENFHADEKDDLNTSKSTNFIDKIDDENDGLKRNKEAVKRVEGLSMPDLNFHKITTLPNLRAKSNRLRSFDALTKAYSEDSFWIKSNGPEFIMKSSLPSREIELVDSKCQHRRIVSVLLLNGQSLHIVCNSITTTAQQVFEAVISSENYIENFFIGLCALIGGDFVFLPNDLKIYKVAPQIWVNISKKTNNVDNVFFTLFLRIKFFLPTLRGISSLESRHMLYLQLRKSVLEKHILCTDDDLISLGGLALQAEVGDFRESMKYSEYFTISHYLPEGVYHRNKEMAKYLRNSHYCRQGLHPKEAEQNFIKYIHDMKEYGFHLYSAVWTTDDATLIDVYVGISLGGIALFERNRQPQANPSTNSKTSYQRKLYTSFEWLEIENLCFSKHILCIVVRKTESLKAKDNNRIKYKLRMDGRKSYFAFSLASEHHQFYMKLRNSFISLKSLSDKLNIPIASSTTSKTTGSKGKKFTRIELNSEKDELILLPHGVSQGDRKNPNDGDDGGGSGIQENIKKIDKQLKASGLRVRNLKKSMLNDNRLIKLKQRFLRRSKSTVGVCSTDKDDKKSSKYDKGNNFASEEISGNSKEENQNKENECPKIQRNDLEPKVYSPNRNRVKMGTRVFSTQFLNKSYDNIYERTLNLCRFESANSIDKDLIDDNLEEFKFKALSSAEKDTDDGGSLKSTSLSSLYYSEKQSNNCSDSPPLTEAYVIHSSIKSEKDENRCNNLTLPNETISDSLLEKFNNMSGNNTVTDRIIMKMTVAKERLNKHQHHHHLNEKWNRNGSDDDRGRCESIKYATYNQRIAKEYPVNNRNVETYIKENSECSKALWHLSRSQESIFINNKFPVRNGSLSINQIGNNIAHDLNDFTLGISIVQGSDNNVYVKDLVKNGPAEKSGIRIGDQIIAVNGISILNLSYAESLRLLQNTGLIVELKVSQIFNKSSNSGLCSKTQKENDNLIVSRTSGMKLNYANGEHRSVNSIVTNHGDEYLKRLRMGRPYDDVDAFLEANNKDPEKNDSQMRMGSFEILGDNIRPTRDKFKSPRNVNGNLCVLSPAKSMPDLPKVVAIIPKPDPHAEDNRKVCISRTASQSRKYLGPVRYPVTPIKTVLSPVRHQLSLLADSDDEQACFLSSMHRFLTTHQYQIYFLVV